MSLYYLILWNQMGILQKHFKKDHVHMHLWTRFYGMLESSIVSLLHHKMPVIQSKNFKLSLTKLFFTKHIKQFCSLLVTIHKQKPCYRYQNVMRARRALMLYKVCRIKTLLMLNRQNASLGNTEI